MIYPSILTTTITFLLYGPTSTNAFAVGAGAGSSRTTTSTALNEMKRPILDQVASTLFNLEQSRVESSSVVDDKGRIGEPMEWSEKESLANRFSEIVASNDLGYMFKQSVADIVAGEYDIEKTEEEIQEFISYGGNGSGGGLFGKILSNNYSNTKKVVMYSFTTCPFCRQAKDYFNENGIEYTSIELDELEGNKGNEIRATLGKITRRTSVPSIFIKGENIGGLNDGTPGLLPLAQSGELAARLK